MRGGRHTVLKRHAVLQHGSVLRHGGLRPEPEAGCCGRLYWRLALPRRSPYERIHERLQQRGYSSRCHQPFLHVLRTTEGHEIVLVPTTGRVQLRIYHLTPATDRQRVIATLTEDLAACLDEQMKRKSPQPKR